MPAPGCAWYKAGVRLVVARCSVEYAGRLGARLPDAVRLLIEEEPGAPDDWLAFLLLSAMVQIESSLTPDEDD